MAKKKRGPSIEQKRLMKDYHDHTCWEFAGAEEMSDDDPDGFIEQWRRNVSFLRDVADETDRMINDYRNKHEGECDPPDGAE